MKTAMKFIPANIDESTGLGDLLIKRPEIETDKLVSEFEVW